MKSTTAITLSRPAPPAIAPSIYPGEQSAQAISKARECIARIQILARDLYMDLHELSDQVTIIQRCDDSPSLVRIQQQIEHINTLRRTMELESFAALTVKHALEDAWKTLP